MEFVIQQKPRVSVCIPTYRGEATIGAAISSVLVQSFRDLELVVIDDGSSDKTRSIVEEFSDPRLTYIRNANNLGPQKNWNRCLEIAQGKYFKLLPHDDLLHPRCLERQISVLEADQDESLALVFCARSVLGPDGTVLTHRGYPVKREGVIEGGVLQRSCVRRGTNLIGEPGSVLFRRTLARRIGSFDATNPYVIDLDYWFRLLAHGDAFYFPEPLASFRVSTSSWSFAIGKNQDRDFLEFVTRVSPGLKTPISRSDLALARITSRINKWLRLVFYSVYLKMSLFQRYGTKVRNKNLG
jgi:glycosyltransferase involved in cell wall biosynthesis